MEIILNQILQDKLNNIQSSNPRKRHERENTFTGNSSNDGESLNEEIKNIGFKKRQMVIRKTITEVEVLRNEGLPVCCKKDCNNKFEMEEITGIRKYVHSLNRVEKKNYIHQHIKIIENEDVSNHKRRFYVNETEVCIKSFILLFGISHNMIYSPIKEHIRTSKLNISLEIINYLQSLANLHDFMPDSKDIHLSYHSHQLVYEKFKSYLINKEDISTIRMISLSYFNKVWRRNMSHIKARKSIRFSKCGKCVKTKERIANTLNQEERN